MEPTGPDRRDRHLHLVRRLRAGVVSAGVIGSLGIAGTVAAAAGDDGSSPAVVEQGPAATGQAANPEQEQDQPFTPDLQQGFGPAHASTGGS